MCSSDLYTNEVFLIISLIIATISSMFTFFTGPSWSLFCIGLLAIIGIALPEQVGKLLKALLKMQRKDEKSVTIIIGVVRIVFAIFIPFIVFAELGLLAGYAFHSTIRDFSKKEEQKPKEEEHFE